MPALDSESELGDDRPVGPGTIVDERFELVRRLGSGGYGTVWEAIDRAAPAGAPHVAVKLLHAEYLKGPSWIVDRFLQEGALLVALEHEHIARAFAFGGGEKQPYIALALIEGESLAAQLERRALRGEHFGRAEVEAIMTAICAAVSHAHASGVLHRDLKPSNILLEEGLRPKVLDFGIAKIAGVSAADLTTQGRRIGSPLYLSPELAEGRVAGEKSDVFSLGVILFELLTLKNPWLIGQARPPDALLVLDQIARGDRPRARGQRPELSVEVDELVHRCLAIDPRGRPQSVAELSRELARVAAGIPSAPEPAVRGAEGSVAVATENISAPRDLTWVRPVSLTSDDAPPSIVTGPYLPAPRGAARRTFSGVPILGFFAVAIAAGILIALGVLDSTVPAPVRAPPAAPAAVEARAVSLPMEIEEEAPEAAVSKRPRRPARVAKTAPPASEPSERSEPSELRAALAALRKNPGDAALLEQLSARIAAGADQLPDRALAVRIKRMTKSAALMFDVDALEASVAELERALTLVEAR